MWHLAMACGGACPSGKWPAGSPAAEVRPGGIPGEGRVLKPIAALLQPSVVLYEWASRPVVLVNLSDRPWTSETSPEGSGPQTAYELADRLVVSTPPPASCPYLQNLGATPLASRHLPALAGERARRHRKPSV